MGTILGLILSDLVRDRRLVAACIAGAVLDLIDKLLGHLQLSATIDNGRPFTHNLLLCLLLLLINVSHQILDAM